MTNSMILWEVVSRIDGKLMTTGCLTHCQRYVNRTDPQRMVSRLRRAKL